MKGSELSVVMENTWQRISTSECRLTMMIELRKMKIGFADLENFDCSMTSKYRSQYFKDRVCNDDGGQSNIVKEAMKLIVRDEEKYLTELYKEREKHRRELARIHTKNSRTYRRILKTLKTDANKTTQEMTRKYRSKIDHLKKKFREDDKDKIKKLPRGLEDFASLSIFDQEAFDNILKESYEVLVIGDLEIDDDERSALKLPPKFSVMEDLAKGGIDFDQEAAFAKIRMEIQRELDEDLQDDEDEADADEEDAEAEAIRLKSEEIMAQARQPYDPVGGTYGDWKRRVTDLKECAKVTLPKPLPPAYEAAIEMRRCAQEKIYEKYRDRNCNKNGE